MSHIHHHGCTCGCHDHHNHHGAAELAEGALVLAHAWQHPDQVAQPDALEVRVTAGLLTLAERLAEEGVILGHLKALLRCGGDGLAFSVTRADTVDKTPAPTWPPEVPVTGWSLTVNVLSLIQRENVTADTLEELFG